MKRYIMTACLTLCLFGVARADALKPLKVGFSLDTKESSLETAWQDFLKSEGEKQGKAAGFDFQWTINVANADPARQAANIDDLITRGVDVIIARAFDSGAIGTSINYKSAAEAVEAAMKRCADYKPAPKAAALCMSIGSFKGECYAISFDPKAGTPGDRSGSRSGEDPRGDARKRRALRPLACRARRGRSARPPLPIRRPAPLQTPGRRRE